MKGCSNIRSLRFSGPLNEETADLPRSGEKNGIKCGNSRILCFLFSRAHHIDYAQSASSHHPSSFTHPVQRCIKKFKFKIMDLLIPLYIFCGAMGSLIPFSSGSFRFFYVLLPLIILVSLFHLSRKRTPFFITLFVPYLLFSAVSAYLTHLNPHAVNSSLSTDQGPVSRIILLACLLFSTFLMADHAMKKDMKSKANYIKVFLFSYFISMIIGYIFFIGYYLGAVSIKWISRFQVLTQFYGKENLLRFSPGSYPNEYGNASSFVLAVLVLLFLSRTELKKQNLFFNRFGSTLFMAVFFLLATGALFLTETRSAYITLTLSLLYIAVSSHLSPKQIMMTVLKVVPVIAIIYLVIQRFLFNINAVFMLEYNGFFAAYGSTTTRFLAWHLAYINFSKNIILGSGFGTASGIHNTYLQLLFETGLLGIALLLLALFIFWRHYRTGVIRFKRQKDSDIRSDLLWKITNIGFIHVLWFATNNHNLNHFLTWFVIFLFLIRYQEKQTARATKSADRQA